MKRKTWLIVLAILAGLCCVAGIVIYLTIENTPPNPWTAESGYHVRGSKVYYYPGFGISDPFEIRDAHAGSFVVIDSSYALDRSHVYVDGMIIPEADPATFEVFDFTFTRDADHVFLRERVFSDDPAHFENVAPNIYRDTRHVYWSADIVSDDPSNLVVVGAADFYTYFKDSTTVFVNGNPIEGADPATFSVVRDGFSRDATHIFYFASMIPEADVSTFEVLDSPFARDAAHAYWMQNVIPEADPDTFVVLNANFECSADAVHAYYQATLIPGFDPASIPVSATVNSCDETRIYFTP